MLDIRWIRENATQVQEAADAKRLNLSVEELLKWDECRRRLLQESEELRRRRNEGSKEVAKAAQAGELSTMESMKVSLKDLNGQLEEVKKELQTAELEFNRVMLLVPNVPSADTPAGASDADNVELRREGDLPVWNFAPKDHVELGALHGMIDIPRGVKVAGSRSYYLKGPGLLLHRAVQQLALDLLLDAGFTPLEVPVLMKEEQMINTGFFPSGRDQAYSVDNEGAWLAGTAEVPLVSYYGDEIVDVKEPVKLAAVSTCFRNEVGSAGRDVRGLYRVHQFSKVEMVVICEPDDAVSDSLHREITGHAERLLSLLELPYRVMAVCAGDMSPKTFKQYDIETWMPSRSVFGETHSSSNLRSFQARRSNIRCRDAEGRLVFCHTLNNTAVASPRILIPLLENHQREDGSIYIPEALRKYLGGRELLVPGLVEAMNE